MSQQIRLCFSDFWGLFDYNDNYFFRILKQRFNVVIDEENPEYVIYSTFGTNFLKYKNAVRILYIAENVRPNYMECDFSIGFDYAAYGGKNLRYPLYVMYGFTPQLLEKKDPQLILQSKPLFCNMVVSNAFSKKRIEFFHLLNKHKKVDSGGRVLNNIGGPVANKMDFIKQYRFTMAFENSSYPGYTTEKIFEPMKVNSIPIYWGSERIGNEFNEKSFINVHAFGSLKEAVSAVLELEHNPEKLSDMLAEPWFIDNKLPEYFDNDRFCNFFEQIVFVKKHPMTATEVIKRQALAYVNIYRKKLKAKILRKYYCQVS
ncbi:glycosyl transferase family 10 (putative fucosyltransferase) [Algoriphagus boseongensis]|uniref:Glycosyl transferase family 10 (Putative fucosyltransferase) n=1 Tax=Algoriphagus boseongensis TaxID=1442587 RepID=A0A4R6TBH5_9BACT|nr:glycosyltransferase family 10 [Algoriphagus boseongensis]TDQ19372.1 glycosyl transferase family 10 (putative fucosyltransferase) [Algoriphagus boseongensis]